MNDKDIQEILDRQGTVPNIHEAEEYQKLYALLNEQEDSVLKPGFAHRVTSHIEAKTTEDPIRPWVVFFSFFFVLAVIGFMLFLGINSSWSLPDSGRVNVYWLTFLGMSIMVIYQVFERKIRKKSF